MQFSLSPNLNLPLGHSTDLAIHRAVGSVEDFPKFLQITYPNFDDFYWGNYLLLKTALAMDELARLDSESNKAPGHCAITYLDSNDALAQHNTLTALGFEMHRATVFVANELPRARHPLSVQGHCVKPIETDAEWSAIYALQARVGFDDLSSANAIDFTTKRFHYYRKAIVQNAGVWLGLYSEGKLLGDAGIFDCGSRVARFQSVETAPEVRGIGVASSLIVECAKVAHAMWGTTSFVLVATEGGAASKLYAELGFNDRETQVSYLKVS